MFSFIRSIVGRVFGVFGKRLEDKQWDIIEQFIRFGIVGASNTIISYGIYTVSLIAMQHYHVFDKIDYIIAQVIAFVLSVLWSFFWNNKLVFTLEEGESRNFWKALIKTYISYSFTGLFLNSVLLILWVDILGISKLIAPIINLIISVPLNFIINKFWAFRKEKGA